MTMAYNLKQIRRTHWRGTTTRSYEACHTRHVIRHVIQNHKVIQGTSYEACRTARHTEPQGHTTHPLARHNHKVIGPETQVVLGTVAVEELDGTA